LVESHEENRPILGFIDLTKVFLDGLKASFDIDRTSLEDFLRNSASLDQVFFVVAVIKRELEFISLEKILN